MRTTFVCNIAVLSISIYIFSIACIVEEWTLERSNESILKEINPEYSLEGLMLKLKLQYFGHLMQRTDSLEKTLILGMIEVRRRQGQDGWMASPPQ